MKRLLTAVLVTTMALHTAMPQARAQPTSQRVSERIAQLRTAFLAGQYEFVATEASALLSSWQLARPERAQAWRLRGLALYFLRQSTASETAMLEYLKLEPDAHLDPALFAPDLVAFFEAVRARNAGLIRSQKPKKRYGIVNLLPPLGQFQNGQRTKGWVLGASEGVFLAANITTFVLLKNNCHQDRTCNFSDGTAKALRTANIASGVLFIGSVIYGIFDGYNVHNHLTRRERLQQSIVVTANRGGAGLTFTTTF